jgi:hypothetical protein
MGTALTHCAYVCPRHKEPSGALRLSYDGMPEMQTQAQAQGSAVQLLWYITAKAQCRVRYNSSCYSYLLERILKLRSSAPYTLQH